MKHILHQIHFVGIGGAGHQWGGVVEGAHGIVRGGSAGLTCASQK